MSKLDFLSSPLLTTFDPLLDALTFIRLSLRPRCALIAENLFLRKQLALYLERQVKPRRAKVATRLSLVLFARLFAWREALTVVKPETLIRWHREGFRLFWRGEVGSCRGTVGALAFKQVNHEVKPFSARVQFLH